MTTNQKASMAMLDVMMLEATKLELGPAEIIPFLLAVLPSGEVMMLMPSTLPPQVKPAKVIFRDGSEVGADDANKTTVIVRAPGQQ